MILKDSAAIERMAIHKVGNKLTEGLHLSKSVFQTNEDLDGLFLDYFLTPFKKQEYFTFCLKVAVIAMLTFSLYSIFNVIIPRFYL